MFSSTAPTSNCATVALLPWGNVFDDFLDSIGVSLETFCKEVTGGWLFGYVQALQLTGVRVVVIIFSARVAAATRLTHAPTGATICVLPASKTYHLVQRFVGSFERMLIPLGNTHKARRPLFPLSLLLKKMIPYLSTPLGLLAHELRSEGCDAILCQEYEDPRFDICVLLGLLTGLPVFASFQGGVRERNWIGRHIRALILQASAGLIVAPQSEAQRVSTHYKVPPAKLARIFNPLDLQMWTGTNRNEARAALQIPLDTRVVVWHGRISMHIKGLDILLDAWERICCERMGQDLRLLFVGTGEDAEELRQRLATRQLQGVHWINEYLRDRTEIRRYLSVGNVYAFPSRREGFPVAPLEAMACSLPVVAANVQAIPDIFEGGEASGGIVVPREDAMALAAALGQVLDDEAWGRELGRRARCRVEASFSLEAVGKQLRTFLLNDSHTSGQGESLQRTL